MPIPYNGEGEARERATDGGDPGELPQLQPANDAAWAGLRDFVSLFERFMEASPDACVILDQDLRYIYFNKAAEALLRLSLSEMRGKRLSLLSESPEAYARLEEYRATLMDGELRSFDAMKPDGASGEQVFRVRVFKVGDGLGFIWTETTEAEFMKQRLLASQDELRALANHLVEVREEERKGLARDLHDELGQTLTAIELEMRFLSRALGAGNPEVGERIGELLILTKQSLEAVRRICAELRPAILDRLGLRAAFEWLAEDYAARNSLRAETRLDFDEESIGPKASTALFRIAQEALVNVVRHARASRVSVSLRRTDRSVELVVADDGIGISGVQVSAHESFGLQGIRERARAFGGAASIRGSPGAGTSLAVSIPLARGGRLP